MPSGRMTLAYQSRVEYHCIAIYCKRAISNYSSSFLAINYFNSKPRKMEIIARKDHLKLLIARLQSILQYNITQPLKSIIALVLKINDFYCLYCSNFNCNTILPISVPKAMTSFLRWRMNDVISN